MASPPSAASTAPKPSSSFHVVPVQFTSPDPARHAFRPILSSHQWRVVVRQESLRRLLPTMHTVARTNEASQGDTRVPMRLFLPRGAEGATLSSSDEEENDTMDRPAPHHKWRSTIVAEQQESVIVPLPSVGNSHAASAVRVFTHLPNVFITNGNRNVKVDESHSEPCGATRLRRVWRHRPRSEPLRLHCVPVVWRPEQLCPVTFTRLEHTAMFRRVYVLRQLDEHARQAMALPSPKDTSLVPGMHNESVSRETQ